jgi:hypothetical protein
MGREVITYRVCDRCTRETVATSTDKFSLNGYRYEVDLCEEHSAMLYSQLMKWADIGKCVGEPTYIDTVSAKARSAQPVVVAPRAAKPTENEKAVAAALKRDPLPASAERWTLTEHACQRRDERGLDMYEVLMACERPHSVTPSKKDPGMEERFRDDILVVVDPSTQRVLTCGRLNAERKVG